MKLFLILVFFFCTGTFVFAYTPILTEVERPYDIVVSNREPHLKQVYLGELENFPIMYELSVDATTTIHAVLEQRFVQSKEPIPFALIVIRKNNRGGGVTEVGRLISTTNEWTTIKYPTLGITFLKSRDFSAEVGPGVYRIEVSTPDNIGHFMLTIGTIDNDLSFFGTIKNAYIIQNFFDYSVIRILYSSYLYYPLGIILVLLGINWTRRIHKTINNAT